MSVHLQKFLRQTPIADLRSYLEDLSPTGFAETGWTAPRNEVVDALVERVHALNLQTRDKLFQDVDRVCQFEGQPGRTALRMVVAANPEARDVFDTLTDVTACALFVLRMGDDVFDQAWHRTLSSDC